MSAIQDLFQAILLVSVKVGDDSSVIIIIVWIQIPYVGTGRERLIRSHSSARFCFELSGNSN